MCNTHESPRLSHRTHGGSALILHLIFVPHVSQSSLLSHQRDIDFTFCFRQAVHAAASFLGSDRSSAEPGPATDPGAASFLLRFKEADMAACADSVFFFPSFSSSFFPPGVSRSKSFNTQEVFVYSYKDEQSQPAISVRGWFRTVFSHQ